MITIKQYINYLETILNFMIMNKQYNITKVNELIVNLGLTHQDLIDAWDLTDSELDNTQVKVGMLWFEDDTFSFERVPNKKIKAIVELIDRDIIYGDLTVSEIMNIEEKKLDWYNAHNYIMQLPYRCRSREWITWHDDYRIGKIYLNYKRVQDTFNLIGKPYRQGRQWCCSKMNSYVGITKNFDTGRRHTNYGLRTPAFVRPILARRIK